MCGISISVKSSCDFKRGAGSGGGGGGHDLRRSVEPTAAMSWFFCPETQNLLLDPLVDKEGRSIDRSTLTQGGTSSAAAASEDEYIPNHALKSAIGECMERATEALPIFETAALNEKLEGQAASIARLNQAKSQIEEDLRETRMEINRMKLAASTLGRQAPAPLSRAPRPKRFGSLRLDNDVHWLLLMSRSILSCHDLTDKKHAFEDVEDELEDLVECRGQTRRSALARWVAQRHLRTPAEEKRGQARHHGLLRSSLLQLIRRSRPAGPSSSITTAAAAQSVLVRESNRHSRSDHWRTASGAKIESADGHDARAHPHRLIIMDTAKKKNKKNKKKEKAILPAMGLLPPLMVIP